ncbi:heterokaryon incompatibility protein-domain-containing protein [Halenospora varia]|nr:heterokaryon incompatibility protein-domain-containing protein [Halenospora varia]
MLAPSGGCSKIRLGFNNTVRQLMVTMVFKDDHRSFYLAHPFGYNGYEPFGSRLLRAPQQPHQCDLVYNSEAAIFRIKQWARDCVQNHSSCKSGEFAPKRLIYLDGRQGHQMARLVQPWPNFSSPFTALSHCWGKTQHVVTTKANYTKHLSSISHNCLPRTFLEAVWITRQLGLKYLWIDSFCIIQDDPDDWNAEVVNMSRLYGAAYIALAASYGPDGDAGMFPLAHINNLILLKNVVTDFEGNFQKVLVTLAPALSLDAESPVHQLFGGQEGDSPPMSSSEPLLGRGWAFQECALSARVVNFTSQEHVWECKTHICCECGDVTGTSFMSALMGSLKQQTLRDHRPSGCVMSTSGEDTESITGNTANTDIGAQQHITEPRYKWEKYVKLYTKQQFTKAEDRAAAFIGFTQTFSNIVSIERRGHRSILRWTLERPPACLAAVVLLNG